MLKKQRQSPRTYSQICIRTFYLIAAYFRSEVPWKVLRQPLKKKLIVSSILVAGRWSGSPVIDFRYRIGMDSISFWSICSGNNGTDRKELVKDVCGVENCFWLFA